MIAAPTQAQAPATKPSPVDPLPPDTGAAGLKQMLIRLQTTARLMQTIAHPDDEDGGMLTLESRGKGVTTLLMTLTRGEGGQNKVGSNLFDVLGVLRALELTASDRYYGVEQRFSRVADFGYSKNPDETFQKWGGHDIPPQRYGAGDPHLSSRCVDRALFRDRSRWTRASPGVRDSDQRSVSRGRGSRNASPSRSRKACNPGRPRNFISATSAALERAPARRKNYTIRLNTGHVNPLLGMSYIQFAMEGLRHQLSQGAGGWTVDPGDRYTYYKLVDSVLPPSYR